MKSVEPIVYIVDDDAAIRESLTLLMDAENLRARSYASARDFLAMAANADFGCLVTDMRMPGMSGLDLMAALEAMEVHLPVVIITAYADVALAVQAMKMGAADFIEKPYREDDLLAAVRAALAGDREGAAPQGEGEDLSRRFAGLSERENMVLAGLLEGKLNKIIAYELGVSVRTVEALRANIMAKTGVSSLSELVRLCLLARSR